jgi:hypothetical protein
VDEVDAWVGALAEEHVASLPVGELVMATLFDQFRSLRDGDRFFYMNEVERSFLEQADIQSLVDVYSVSLVDIIAMNTHMDHGDMPMGFFTIPEPHTAVLLLAACGMWTVTRRRGRKSSHQATRDDGHWP